MMGLRQRIPFYELLITLTRKKTHIESHRDTFSRQISVHMTQINLEFLYQKIFIKPVVG